MEKFKTRRQENGAMKIMEALSGVDEELLAACEEETNRLQEQRKTVFFARTNMIKYAGLAAACLAFAVVGVGVWNVTLGPGAHKAYEAATADGGHFGFAGFNDSKAESAVCEEEIVEDCEEDLEIDECILEEAAEEEIVSTEPGAPTEEVMKENMYAGKAIEITAEEASRTKFGKYLPTELPAGWVAEHIVFTGGDAVDDTESMTVAYTDGAERAVFDFREMKNASIDINKVDDLADVKSPVLAADDLSLAVVKQCLDEAVSGRPVFSICYPEEVLLEVRADAEAEDLWKLIVK